nr:MAG TPA: hypothetical protein [Caudoviricetes sp.]
MESKIIPFNNADEFATNYIVDFLIDGLINKEFRKNILTPMDIYRLGMYSSLMAFNSQNPDQKELVKQYLFEVYKSGLNILESVESSFEIDNRYQELGMDKNILTYTRFISISFYKFFGNRDIKLQKAYNKWQEEKNKITKPGSY